MERNTLNGTGFGALSRHREPTSGPHISFERETAQIKFRNSWFIVSPVNPPGPAAEPLAYKIYQTTVVAYNGYAIRINWLKRSA